MNEQTRPVMQTHGVADNRSIYEVVTEKSLAGAVPIRFSLNSMANWQAVHWLFDPQLRGIEFSDGSKIMVKPAMPDERSQTTSSSSEEDRVERALADALKGQESKAP